jgi:plastocyanin
VRRFSLISAVAVAVALALPAVAGAAPREIDVDDDFFAPRNPPTRNLQSGPSFRWTSVPGATNDHNVRQDDRLFFSGQPTDPLTFQIRASAGSYHYYCTLHGSRSGGMAGRVKVKPIRDRSPRGLPFTVIWASPSTNTGGSFDVRFKRGSGDWRIWKNDTEKFRGVFGRNRNPVRVRANRVYKFQVRSERSSNTSRRSDWSPTLRVGT